MRPMFFVALVSTLFCGCPTPLPSSDATVPTVDSHSISPADTPAVSIQTPSPIQSVEDFLHHYQAEISLGLNVTEVLVDSIDAGTTGTVSTDLRVARICVTALSDSITFFEGNQNSVGQCRVHRDSDNAITAILHLLDGLVDLHVQIPASLKTNLLAFGAYVDNTFHCAPVSAIPNHPHSPPIPQATRILQAFTRLGI